MGGSGGGFLAQASIRKRLPAMLHIRTIACEQYGSDAKATHVSMHASCNFLDFAPPALGTA